MLRMFIVKILLLVMGLAILGIGLLNAQSEVTPTPIDQLTCDPQELRQKQAELAAILNTFSQDTDSEPGLALDNLFKVGTGYQELALNCGYIPPDAATRFIGKDVQRILNMLSTVIGDPINGQVLYNSPDLACASCHEISGGVVAPHTEGTYTRILETRLNDPQLAGYTPEQYIVESIVLPSNYVVPNYQNVMLSNFGERLTLQDLADLLAFLESQDGPSPE